VEYDVQCAETFMRLDSSQIEQMLINLMKNALETEATNVWVKVALSENGRHVVMSVEDNGGGISQEVVDNIFTPFFTTKEGGQGIGLAVCRQIVSNHGGLIGVENKSYADGSKGVRFTLRLPM
jgi:signal transduction histidine kinase